MYLEVNRFILSPTFHHFIPTEYASEKSFTPRPSRIILEISLHTALESPPIGPRQQGSGGQLEDSQGEKPQANVFVSHCC